jgi:ferredoxin-NADP reductase/MOSC domain-containing protein YiiM/ferredoxin
MDHHPHQNASRRLPMSTSARTRRAETQLMRLLSVNVGLPGEVSWRGRTVNTAIFKSPVTGRRRVARLNVDGDGQADLVGHGGEHRAVYVYDRSAYEHWSEVLGRDDLVPGHFGENFTVEGMPDDEVCVGDRYRIGDATFEVTQPRVTCFKVGLRLEEPRMPALLYSHGRPGFYLRVLAEGEVGAGDQIERIAVGPEAMSVREVSALLYLPGHTTAGLRRALAIPALSEGWRGSFRALLEQHDKGAAGNQGLAPPSTPPAWPGLRQFRVAAAQRESASVRSFVLEPVNGEPLPAFVPGQFLALKLEPPGAPAPLLRSYSLASPADGRGYRIAVKREPGGPGSAFLHDRVGVGDVLPVGAPRGSFTLDMNASGPVVLLSAGVGVTPVLAMLGALARAGSQRSIWWVHGARSGAEHAFAAEARDLLSRLPATRSQVRYSRPRPEDRQGLDFDEPGRIDLDALLGLGVPRDADFYMCGPTGFLRELTAALLSWGVELRRLHREVFGPEPRDDAPDPHPPPGPPGRGPQVAFSRSALTIPWDERYGSLLELAEACDVPADWSCRTGVCHRCESGLVDGAVSYDPEPLDDPAPGQVLLCCSRPHSPVTIDL